MSEETKVVTAEVSGELHAKFKDACDNAKPFRTTMADAVRNFVLDYVEKSESKKNSKG